jgi:hypothetical protein
MDIKTKRRKKKDKKKEKKNKFGKYNSKYIRAQTIIDKKKPK